MRTKKLKDVSTVLADALALPLADRVRIALDLKNSVAEEVKNKDNEASEAEKIAHDLLHENKNGKP